MEKTLILKLSGSFFVYKDCMPVGFRGSGGKAIYFTRSPWSGYAIDIGPSGLVFLSFLTLITKLTAPGLRTLGISPQLLRLIRFRYRASDIREYISYLMSNI